MDILPPLKPKRVRKVRKSKIEVPVFKIIRGNFAVSFEREGAVEAIQKETPPNQIHVLHNK